MSNRLSVARVRSIGIKGIYISATWGLHDSLSQWCSRGVDILSALSKRLSVKQGLPKFAILSQNRIMTKWRFFRRLNSIRQT